MSAINTQFKLTTESYAERAQLVRNLRDECSSAERGDQIDLHQTAEKLNDLVHALKTDLIAMGRTNVSRELHNKIQAHKKDLTGLTVRVTVLSAKASGVPAWVKPVGFAALAVGGLALTALAASRFASSTDGSSYGGSYGGYAGATQVGQDPTTLVPPSVPTLPPIDDKGHFEGPCTLKGNQGGAVIVRKGSRVVSRDWELFVTPWGTCSNRPQGGAVIVREGSRVVSRDWELFVKSESTLSYLMGVGPNLFSYARHLIGNEMTYLDQKISELENFLSHSSSLRSAQYIRPRLPHKNDGYASISPKCLKAAAINAQVSVWRTIPQSKPWVFASPERNAEECINLFPIDIPSLDPPLTQRIALKAMSALPQFVVENPVKIIFGLAAFTITVILVKSLVYGRNVGYKPNLRDANRTPVITHKPFFQVKRHGD